MALCGDISVVPLELASGWLCRGNSKRLARLTKRERREETAAALVGDAVQAFVNTPPLADVDPGEDSPLDQVRLPVRSDDRYVQRAGSGWAETAGSKRSRGGTLPAFMPSVQSAAGRLT